MKETYKLSHTVLYAKRFYKQSDDLIADLKKVMQLDNYNGECMNVYDIYSVLLTSIKRLPEINALSDMRTFIDGIHPNNVWKFGYTGEYNQHLAVIQYILSELRFIESHQWSFVEPDFEILPKGQGITKKFLNEVRSRHKLKKHD